MNEPQNQYVPDHVSPPGDTLSEVLEERGMGRGEFAQRVGVTPKHVSQILNGSAPITPEMALKFERVLGIPARFWNNREQQYRDFLARKAENRDLAQQSEWLKNFKHLSTMRKYGWIAEAGDTVGALSGLLDFFRMASPDTWQARWAAVEVHYRRSQTHEQDPYALAAWLRRGEIVAEDIDCAPYDRQKFQGTLWKARKLTTEPPEVFQPELVSMCAACGVAVAFVPELPKTASGATRWLSPTKALIQLSLKYKTDDHLWFTFFHEAGHILLHAKKDIFIETDSFTGKNEDQQYRQEEEQANRFAANLLIPEPELRAFASTFQTFSKASIEAFARKQGIAPGIVVGQLQHMKRLPFTHCNDLKRRFVWRIQQEDKGGA